MTTHPETPANPGAVHCARCAAELRPGTGNLYRITIEAVADPAPATFCMDDPTPDIRKLIEQLLAQMEGLSEQEALDQVCRRLTRYLCGPCYREWIKNPMG